MGRDYLQGPRLGEMGKPSPKCNLRDARPEREREPNAHVLCWFVFHLRYGVRVLGRLCCGATYLPHAGNHVGNGFGLLGIRCHGANVLGTQLIRAWCAGSYEREPKVTITTQVLMTTLKSEVSATRTAIAASLKGGLKAAVYAGTLAFFARAQGASRQQISLLILGREKVKESDGGEAKVYRAAMRLAQHWQANGVFGPMVGANSFEAATKAALTHLAHVDVRSLEGLAAFLGGKAAPEKKPLPKRIEAAVAAAVKAGEFSTVDATQIAELICNAMGYTHALAFHDKVLDVVNEMAVAVAAKASTAATPMPEPSNEELYEAQAA